MRPEKHLVLHFYNIFILLNIKIASFHNTVAKPFVVYINSFGFQNV
jgi:hypothetical protein